MNNRVTGCDACKSKLRLKPVFQVRWALPAGLGIDEVRDSRYGPGLLDKGFGFGQERPR
jgi:hypothetical protein